MAQEKVYSIRIDGVDKAVNSINDLETGVKTLEEKLSTAKIGSAEFKALQKELSKAKSQLKDFELQVEGLDKEQRATALVDTFNGLTGAVGAVSSAFIAFGAESGAIEEAEKKLLGVIGVVSGLRDASNGIVAAQKLLASQNIALGASFKKAFSAGQRGATALKGALISTGIGAIVVAVGLLIQYWDEFVDLLGLGATAGQENLDIAEEQTAQAEKQLAITNSSTELLKEQGLSDKEILDLKIKQTQEVITALQAQLIAQKQIKKEQIESAKRNADILAGVLRFLTAPLEILLRTIDSIGSAFGKDFGLAKGLLDANKALAGTIFSGDTTEIDEGIEATEQKLLELQNTQAGYRNQQKADRKKASEDAQKQREDADAKEKQAILDAEKAKRDLLLAQQKTTLDALKVGYDNKIKDIEIAQAKELEQENLTEEAKKAIREKYDAERLTALEEYNNAVIEENARLAEETEAQNTKDAEDAKALRDAKIQLANDGFNAVIALAEAFSGKNEKQQKRAFQIAKSAQLAQATMNGILAVQNAFQTANASPLTALFPAYPYIQAGLAGAFALANIKKIASTTFESAGSGSDVKPPAGGGSGAGAGTRTSSPMGIGSFGAPNLGGDITQSGGRSQTQQPQAVRAYVLAGDVVDGVNADERINKRRTL